MKLFGKVTRNEVEDVKGAIEQLGHVADGYKRRLSSHQARLAGIERRIRALEEYLSAVPIRVNEEEEMDEEVADEEGERETALDNIRRNGG